MADIRINSLPTTASASSSDDFLALDGATNGTRKLNAYSPTFGGNLTVSGTSSTITLGSTNTANVAVNASGALTITSANGQTLVSQTSSGAHYIEIKRASQSTGQVGLSLNGGTSGNTWLMYQPASSNTLTWFGNSANRMSLDTSGNLTLDTGNLTVSGTGNSSVAGTLLVATTTNSSNGKLQLADHTTSAGGIGFGTDTSLFRSAAGNLAVYGTGTDSRINFSHSTSTAGKGFDVQLDTAKDAYVWQRENRSLFFGTNNTTALTLDASQNATFAGRVISNGTGFGVGANSDANTPFHALTTTLNGGFGALIRNTNAGANATASILAESDAGTAIFRNHSLAHSIWPGKTLIGAPAGGTGMVILTGGAGDPIDFWTNTTQALSIDASQNIVPGTAALATTATNGFIYLQTCAGAPTGVPTSYTGRVASIYDTTNNKLYIYNGGWKSVTLA